jgi:putative ribosome biogenesis GTPase RsgA
LGLLFQSFCSIVKLARSFLDFIICVIIDLLVFHHFSDKHIGRYVDEFVFRLNDDNVKRLTLDRIVKAQLNDKTQIFLGQSGVGKSSLINELIPELIATIKHSSSILVAINFFERFSVLSRLNKAVTMPLCMKLSAIQ